MKKIINIIFIILVSLGIASCTSNPTQITEIQTTETQTTIETSTTEAPTTDAPTTEAPTTLVPTTELPTTELPTTEYITTEAPTTTEALTLENVFISDQTKRFYDLDEAFDSTSLVLTASFSNGDELEVTSNLYQLRSFNSTSPGVKTAFIIYDQYLIEYHYIVLEDFAFEIDMAYYEDAINLNGDTLKVTLGNIISEGFIELLYGDAIEVLEHSDVDPENPNNVIVVYEGDYGISVPTGYSSAIDGYYWNREHVWPQSRLGVNVSYTNDFPSKATDVHNLKPADGDANASRSNDYFDYIDGPDTYEPRDEVKGDIARILFYMATRYPDLTLNENIYSDSSDKTMGILSVLLEWNQLDPVDDFERNRNEVIFSYQGNRNPFIDYPEFAELIWGDQEN